MASFNPQGRPSAASLNTTPHFYLVKPTRRPRLQVLTIGIDNYQAEHISNLLGAVADADEIDRFCAVELQVPREQIKSLRNEEATRDAILQAFKDLRVRKVKGKPVLSGDPFLIYFSGHGARHVAPSGWVTGTRHISLIVPYDHGHCIPDLTIATLLDELAEKISDNITVIFDCCHSGSGTRYSDDENERRERGIILEEGYAVPPTLDIEIWGSVPRAMGAVNGFANSATRSHVLLAACREEQKAHEQKRRGEFTKGLLMALQDIPTHKITYRDLLGRIPPIENQTPQCEGYHSGRLLFNALVPSNERTTYGVDQDEVGGRILMDAGSAHGITINALFSIYPSTNFHASDSPLSIMFAKDVGAFKTELSYAPASGRVLPPGLHCVAFQTTMDQAATLRLHIFHSRTPNDVSSALMTEVTRANYPISLQTDQSRADLSARGCDGRIEFSVCGPLATRAYGLKLQAKIDLDANCIYRVLSAAAQFFWHLRRAPQRPTNLRRSLSVDLHELRIDHDAPLDSRLRAPYKRHGGNIICPGSVVHVSADDRTAYGITITSELEEPLHIWAYYFDCSDLSITNYYRPPMLGSNSEPSLPAKGELGPGKLPIGYGSGGGRPFKYFLRDGQDLDVGFIKIFILTKSVDLSSIPQSSPFDGRDIRGTRSVDLEPAVDAWDTITITVVQHRPASTVT